LDEIRRTLNTQLETRELPNISQVYIDVLSLGRTVPQVKSVKILPTPSNYLRLYLEILWNCPEAFILGKMK